MSLIIASGAISNNNSLSQFIKNSDSKSSWDIQLIKLVLIIFNFDNERSRMLLVLIEWSAKKLFVINVPLPVLQRPVTICCPWKKCKTNRRPPRPSTPRPSSTTRTSCTGTRTTFACCTASARCRRMRWSAGTPWTVSQNLKMDYFGRIVNCVYNDRFVDQSRTGISWVSLPVVLENFRSRKLLEDKAGTLSMVSCSEVRPFSEALLVQILTTVLASASDPTLLRL